MSVTFHELEHPRGYHGRFVDDDHQQPSGGQLAAIGTGAALAGGALVLVTRGPATRLYRLTRNAMLDETHLDRVIAGNANLRALAARMARGGRPEVSRYFAPNSWSQGLIDFSRGKVNESLEPHELMTMPQKVRVIRQAIAAADPAHTPGLYRALFLDEPLKAGDRVDFGPIAAFSSELNKAEAFGDHIFHLPGGQVRALRLSDSYLNEWLTGGMYRVEARAQTGGDWHYHISPVVAP